MHHAFNPQQKLEIVSHCWVYHLSIDHSPLFKEIYAQSRQLLSYIGDVPYELSDLLRRILS